MNKAQRILFNTLLLTFSSFLIRTASVSFNVYLTNKIGAEGIGLFQLITSVYALALTFSFAGIRLATMRSVADNIALDRKNSRQTVRICLTYSFIMGIIISFILYNFATQIGAKLISDNDSISSLRILSFSLPFAAMSASLNGYFTALGKLTKYTFVLFLEQIVKISVAILLLKSAKDIESSCNSIVYGIVVGEVASMLMSFSVFMKYSKNSQYLKGKSKNIFSSMLHIAIPDAVGADIRSTLSTIEHLLIPVGFRKSGCDTGKAIATYGVIHGMSLPIVLYPSALLVSLSGLLVPEISAMKISGQNKRINYIIARVLHLTLLFSIGVAGIMYFCADELSLSIYGNNQASVYIKVFAPLIPVMYSDMTVDGMLKGLGQQVSYMKYNIIDASICVALVYFLVPLFSAKGYIIVVFVSEIINFFLSFRRLTIVSEVYINLVRDIITPILSVIAAGIIKNFTTLFIFGSNITKINTTAAVIISITIYLLFLRIFLSIDKEEVNWIKKIFKVNLSK